MDEPRNKYTIFQCVTDAIGNCGKCSRLQIADPKATGDVLLSKHLLTRTFRIYRSPIGCPSPWGVLADNPKEDRFSLLNNL